MSRLPDAQKLGADITQSKFHMLDLGRFPALMLDGDHRVTGEVWLVSSETLAELDRIEGYPDFYDRVKAKTHRYPGEHWLYYLPDPENWTGYDLVEPDLGGYLTW